MHLNKHGDTFRSAIFLSDQRSECINFFWSFRLPIWQFWAKFDTFKFQVLWSRLKLTCCCQVKSSRVGCA